MQFADPLIKGASLKDGAINFQHRYLYQETFVEILEVKIDSATDDSTGKVVGGYLKLRGRLKASSLDAANSATYGSPYLDLHRRGCVNAHFDSNEDVGAMKFYCLSVRDDSEFFLHGLLLLPTGSKNEFRRIGTFKSWDRRANATFGTVYRPRSADNRGRPLGLSQYVRKHYQSLVTGWTEHFITIV